MATAMDGNGYGNGHGNGYGNGGPPCYGAVSISVGCGHQAHVGDGCP